MNTGPRFSSRDVLGRLSSSLNRRDEVPNVELAAQLAEVKDEKAIEQLVKNLENKNMDIRSDCIKVLYEIGARNPHLISDYSQEFLGLLKSKDNRLVWGGMTALDEIVSERPDAVRDSLSAIVAAANGASVISRDHAVSILVKLSTMSDEEAFKLLLGQLASCPTNQLPMYAEMSEAITNTQRGPALAKVLRSRLSEIDKESKRRRVEKVISKFKQ